MFGGARDRRARGRRSGRGIGRRGGDWRRGRLDCRYGGRLMDIVAAPSSVEQRTIRKVYLRLLPLLFLAYFVCYLDRINVGFAALTMNKELGFNASIFAFGATAFFWGYCLFEIPSNVVLEKVGARLWIARIM